jgi:hypothetical protein
MHVIATEDDMMRLESLLLAKLFMLLAARRSRPRAGTRLIRHNAAKSAGMSLSRQHVCTWVDTTSKLRGDLFGATSIDLITARRSLHTAL